MMLAAGHLEIFMDPCTKSGGDIGDDYVDDPSELVGAQFIVKSKRGETMFI